MMRALSSTDAGGPNVWTCQRSRGRYSENSPILTTCSSNQEPFFFLQDAVPPREKLLRQELSASLDDVGTQATEAEDDSLQRQSSMPPAASVHFRTAGRGKGGRGRVIRWGNGASSDNQDTDVVVKSTTTSVSRWNSGPRTHGGLPGHLPVTLSSTPPRRWKAARAMHSECSFRLDASEVRLHPIQPDCQQSRA